MKAMQWDYSDLVRVSGQSRSVVSQWLGRSSKTIKTIGKLEAAEAIEQASGFAALWIAKGLGPKRVAPPAVTVPNLSAMEPTPHFGAALGQLSVEAALEVLGQRLAMDMPGDVRNDVADALHKLATRRGSARDQRIVLQLLDSSIGKRQPTG